MSNAICKNCFHWSSRDGQWGWCSLAEGFKGKPLYNNVLSYARDMELDSASLITNENFGCVQYEAGESNA